MDKQSIDAKLINHIVETYSDTILRIAFHYTDNRYDAQDIAQNVFLSLLNKKIADLSEGELKAYIIRCAINKCKDFYRSRLKRKIIPLEEAANLAAEEKDSVLDEVRELPAKYRDVIYLHYYEGYTLNQIGKILHISPNTAGTRLRRARERLKNILLEEKDEQL